MVLDNYDSFTYNLTQYLQVLGALTRVFQNDEISTEEIQAMAPEKIVISPGPCTPDEAGISLEVVRRFAPGIPLLGVCLGHQTIGQAFGGVVARAPRVVHGKTAAIYHDGRTIYKGLTNPLVATCYHSLMVERGTLPDCLEISAETEDGIVMGLRHRKYAVEGVQFHPESILTAEGKDLLKNFLQIQKNLPQQEDRE